MLCGRGNSLTLASSALVVLILCNVVPVVFVVVVDAVVEFSRLVVSEDVVVAFFVATTATSLASGFTVALEGALEEAVEAGVTRGLESNVSVTDDDVTEGLVTLTD